MGSFYTSAAPRSDRVWIKYATVELAEQQRDLRCIELLYAQWNGTIGILNDPGVVEFDCVVEGGNAVRATVQVLLEPSRAFRVLG